MSAGRWFYGCHSISIVSTFVFPDAGDACDNDDEATEQRIIYANDANRILSQ